MQRLRNSRLRSSLVWGADPAEGLFRQIEPTPLVGPVPSEWRALLLARHLNEYYERIASLVRNPVELELCPGLRRVSVLGAAVFEVDANGFVEPYIWSWRGEEFDCFRQPPEYIGVGNTPYGWRWLEMFRRGFVAELGWRLRRSDEELRDYSVWLFARFRRRLVRECDLRHMREQIQAALALDPLAVRIARRIRLTCAHRPVATLAEYNHVIARLPAYRMLQKEAPNLVPLYAACAETLALVRAGEPAQLLRQHLVVQDGLSQRTWALAHNMRPRWLRLVADFYTGSTSAAALDLLNIMEVLGCRKPPPLWYLWDLLQLFGNDAQRRQSYVERVLARLPAFQRVTALLERAGPEQHAMRPALYDVLAWIVDTGGQLNPRTVKRAGWPWFVRHAVAWREQQTERAARGRSWPVPFRRFESAGYTVVTLSTPADLVQEARAMRHCADRFVSRCQSRDHLVLSVRSPARNRPLATVLLKRRRDGWFVAQVAGAANSLPRPIARRLADEAADLINAVRWGASKRLSPPPLHLPRVPTAPSDASGESATDAAPDAVNDNYPSKEKTHER